ncbi:MAG TPA: urea ABC transporter permease subunit UrtC, partial [Verrucomicrobiota bacterium]|nr:urea ABC transporter permease subunit UrtC [Verrucomicrobiota bacterium]
HALAEQWPYILGALFIFVTLFMPNGIVGLPKQLGALKKRWAARKSVAPEAALAAVEPPREPASK